MNSLIHCSRKSLLVQKLIKSLLIGFYWHFAVCGVGIQAGEIPPEYAAKAASLSLFPDYVKWPTVGDSTITLGILGDDPFDGALAKMNLKRSKRIEDLKDCQVIFIGKSEQANLSAIIESLGTANILTVGESEGFAKQGGMIGFVMDGDKVRFEINTAAARRAGLGIDLRLLKLAVRVFNS